MAKSYRFNYPCAGCGREFRVTAEEIEIGTTLACPYCGYIAEAEHARRMLSHALVGIYSNDRAFLRIRPPSHIYIPEPNTSFLSDSATNLHSL